MSGAILILLLLSKILVRKTRSGLRHLCWLIVAAALLIPYRPAMLTFTLPREEVYREIEAPLYVDLDLTYDQVYRHDFAYNAHSFVLPPVQNVPNAPVYVPDIPAPQAAALYITNESTTTEATEVLCSEYYALAEVAEHVALLTTLRENIWQLLFIIWVAGLLGFALFHVIGHALFKRKMIKNNEEITAGSLYNLFIRICCHVGIRRKARLMVNHNATIPMMHGFFRPVIVLPAYLQHVDPVQQRLVILHEALHIKRGDILARLLCLAAVVMHWFNPLVHLMDRLAVDESEKACDDAVLRHSDAETRMVYSRTLIDAAWIDTKTQGALAYALTNGGKGLKSRLRNIITKTTPKRWVLVICTVLMVAGVVAFSLVQFGGRGKDEPGDTESGYANGDGSHTGLHASEGDTLKIFAPIVRNAQIRMTAAANALHASHGIGFELTDYLIEEHAEYIEHMLSLFAGGVGPDIFVTMGNTPLYRFIENGFIMDINEIIPDRADFYENALAGFEVGGRLYAMPMGFNFQTVGINAALPPEIINRFAALETASASQLIDIYAELVTTHPEFVDFYFSNSLHPVFTLQAEVTHALDFSNREAAFPEGTAAMLEGVRTHIHNNTNPDLLINDARYEDMQNLQGNTVFHIPTNAAVSNAFFPFEREFFTHYIPVADERGALVNRSISLAVVIGAHVDPDVAWAFIEALLNETALNGWGGDIHISRPYAREYLERGINNELLQLTLRPILTNESAAVSHAADRIMVYAEMPSVRPVVYLMPWDVISGTFNAFLAGEGSGSDAVRAMEGNMLAWMGTEREVEAYVPEPPPPPEPDPFVRTLTIRIDNGHSALFQQAATAMNASWQAQGLAYTFALDMDVYRWDDFEGIEARRARLQTELMAGSGPDIFLTDTWGMNFRGMARNGFLADFYTLMDNCERTSRGEFYENVLEAFEFDGGLYLFPTSFAFHHVGINARLPQEEQNRFARADTVTQGDMMELYLRVRDEPQLARLSYGYLWGLSVTPFHAVQAALYDFIDFGTRRASFTDPRFIEYLEITRRAYEGFDGMFNISNSNAPGVEEMSRLASAQIFEERQVEMSGANPFFSRTANHFVHYRPVVNNAGQLVINPDNWFGVWALLAVNANGQPELAWEFITYLLRTYPRATGRALASPYGAAPWAGHSVATSILRENANMTRRFFENAVYTDINHWGRHMDWDIKEDEADVYIDAAMARIAALNEMPVALIHPLIPPEVWGGPESVHFNNFMAGAITAEAFAQLIQNSISLWLIE